MNVRPNSSTIAAVVLVLLLSTPFASQSRSPLLNKIVQAVHTTNRNWHFIPGFCTCPALVRSQTDYAFGDMYYRKLTGDRRVSIYIAYVPSVTVATEWMRDLHARNRTAGYQRQDYSFADEASLWIYPRGGAALYLRSDAFVAELTGSAADVQFFARTLGKRWAR
jgi:hypothetical protein